MTIDQNSNVGIGTNNPLTKFHIDGTASPTIRLESTSGPYTLISSNTVGSLEIAADAGNDGVSSNINFKIDNSDVVRFTANNVGLGTSSPINTGTTIFTAGAGFSQTATKDSNMHGLTLAASTNENTMTGIWFGTGGGSHWAGIAGARSSYTTDWGTHLSFYTHPANFANITDTNERVRIDSSGNLNLLTNEGELLFYSTYTVGSTDRAKIKTIGAGGGSGYGGDLVFYTKNPSNIYSERIRINSSGFVGIGTDSPIAPLTVRTAGGIDTGITLTDGSSHRGKIYYDGSQSLNIAGTSGPGGADIATLTFLTGAGTQSPRMVITRDGKIGIGVTSPARKLHVNAPDNDIAVFESDSHGIVFQDDGTRFEIVGYKQSNPGYNDIHLRADVDNTLVLKASTGNVGIGTASPTAKLQVSGDLTVGSTSAETRVTVDGGVKASAFWASGNAGWLATWSPEGWETVVKTGSISSSSGTTSLDILSVYTDGHWGGSMFGEIWLYTSYYGSGIKKYTFKAARSGYAVVTLVDESGYEMAGTVDVHGQAVIGTGTHSGQSVAKSVIRMNTGSSYQNVYAIIKIGYSDNSRKIFDNRSADGNVETDRITSGGCYHFRSVDLTGMPYVTTI